MRLRLASLTFHDYRKDLESVVFVDEEFLHKMIKKKHMFVDLAATMNILCCKTVYRSVARI